MEKRSHSSEVLNATAEILRGQTMHLPNLRDWFSQWPTGPNDRVADLRPVMDQMIDSIVTDEEKRRRIKDCNFAWFTSHWYRETPWPELQVAALFVLWIFIWDDEIDSGESTYSTDVKLAATYRQQSLDYARWCLGQGQSTSSGRFGRILETIRRVRNTFGCIRDSASPSEPPCPYPCMKLFRDWAFSLRGHMNQYQLDRVFREVETYITQCGVEISDRNAHATRTPEAYMKMRMGTSGVYILCSFQEYCIKSNLPPSLIDSAEVTSLWHLTNVIIVLLNDILSLKKEMAQNNVISIIPAKFHSGGCADLDEAVHETLKDLTEAMEAFEKVVDDLERLTINTAMYTETMQLVKHCRWSVTGTLEFSLTSKRYGITQYSRGDGTLDIVLD